MKVLTLSAILIALISSGSTKISKGVIEEIVNHLETEGDKYVTSKTREPLCDTETCRKASEDILKLMDQTSDPCNDFYQFSCGKLLQNGTYKDQLLYSPTKMIMDGLYQIRNMDENLYELQSLKKMRSFIRSCINHGYSDTLKYFKVIVNNFGGWPVLSKENSSGEVFDWLKSFRILKRTNLSIAFPVDIDETMFSSEIIFLRGSENIYRTGKKRLQEMINLAVRFGADKEIAKKDMEDCLQLETKLLKAKASDPFNYTEWKKINKTDTWFPWEEILKESKDQLNIKYGWAYTTHPTFVTVLGKILEATPKRIQANYMMLRFIELNLHDISRGYLFLMQDQANDVEWISKYWCPYIADSHFLIPIVSQYVKRSSHIFHQDAVVHSGLFDNIKIQYLNQIKQHPDHYSASDIVGVEDFMKNLTLINGYPSILLNETRIDEAYANFLPETSNFFKTAWKLSKISQKSLSDLDLKNIKVLLVDNAYFITKGVSNPTYQIVTTLTKISPPNYSPEYPQFINYARLGTTLAHELAHGVVGVPLSTLNRTLSNRKCIEDQYARPGFDSSKTNEEDIADNAGWLVAYKAYMNKLEQQDGIDLQLPNLNYTAGQMFWISSGTEWCEVPSKHEGDEHSPHRIRINNVFSNLKEFRVDFQCSDDSQMRSTNECTGVR